MQVDNAQRERAADGLSTREGVATRLSDWTAQIASMLQGLPGVDCLRVAATLLPRPEEDAPLHAAVPPGLLARPETAVAVAEAQRAGRVAVAGALPGSPGGAGRPSSIVIPLDDMTGWVEIEAILPDEAALTLVIDRVRLGLGWVMFLRTRAADAGFRQAESQAVNALKAVVSIAGGESFGEAARALVTDLCTRFGCDRVSLGLVRRRSVRVVAISHTGRFSRAMALVRLLRAAMEEAVDQEEVLAWPAPDDGGDRVLHAQEALAERNDRRSILTIPLFDGTLYRGALVFERDDGRFDAQEVETLEALAGVLTPLIREKRENDRWVVTRAGFAVANILRAAVGRRHFIAKLSVLAAAAVLAVLMLVERPLTVVADAVVEGSEQRAVTAAFDGFLASADAREGDRVAAGDVLFRLDERDFALDRLRLAALRAQAELELDRAISARDRAETAIVEGRLRQIDAELALVEQQIDRSRVVAPFDALVVSGDLSRSIGRAVSRGETLMVLAPLGEYRVSLSVQESDIADLNPGQEGVLKLAAIPERDFALDLVEMIPVARYEEGTTLYSVDARLRDDGGLLLHGMTGAARIEIRPVPLIVLWGKPLWDRVQVWFWRNVAI
jgi:multidrug efflux pump subunit AcrA (membrane-fusion protein)